MFYMSFLKKVVGQRVVLKELPPIDEEGKLILEPMKIVDVQERRLKSHTIKKFLAWWKDLLIEDATWDDKKILEHPSLWDVHLDIKFVTKNHIPSNCTPLEAERGWSI